MSDIHSHQCGTAPGENAPGCGHEWEHDGDNLPNGGDKAHYCPACGRGPWTFRVRDQERDKVVERLHSFLTELMNGRGGLHR